MSMNLQPTLENDFVLMRPIELDDFKALYQAANEPEIWKLHQNPDRYERAVLKNFLKEQWIPKGHL
ncbi:MAG: hypothetical protein WBB27_07115 [Maribacter sp.]